MGLGGRSIILMSKPELQMPNKISNDKKYDLEERTAVFGERVIEFARKIKTDEVSKSIVSQFVRAGTSVGANYCEADCAETKKDFEHKLGICKKESKETKFWLRMIAKAVPDLKDESRLIWREVNELNLIFSAIINKSKNNLTRN